MNVLVTGAGGFIGTALAPVLERAGHRVLRAVRRPPARDGEVRWDPATGRIGDGPPGGWEAVVHLAGASLAGRWSTAFKREATESRVGATRALCEALARTARLPRVLVVASAIGVYGDRADEILDEDSPPGRGFLAGLAVSWEGACEAARTAGVRVVHLRFGLVLAPGGGALRRMLLPFRLGLGGPLGDGRQFWSWVTLGDAIAAARHALEHSEVGGPVNVVAPQPVRQREFAAALGRVLRRPAVLPVPAVALRLLLGEMGGALLLASARVRPSRLAASGFAWRHPVVEPALREMLGSSPPAPGTVDGRRGPP
jgi:uncharacterized protein (TIGR01777 family)